MQYKGYVIAFCIGCIGAFGGLLFMQDVKNCLPIVAIVISATLAYRLEKNDKKLGIFAIEILLAIVAGILMEKLNSLNLF